MQASNRVNCAVRSSIKRNCCPARTIFPVNFFGTRGQRSNVNQNSERCRRWGRSLRTQFINVLRGHLITRSAWPASPLPSSGSREMLATQSGEAAARETHISTAPHVQPALSIPPPIRNTGRAARADKSNSPQINCVALRDKRVQTLAIRTRPVKYVSIALGTRRGASQRALLTLRFACDSFCD